MTKLASLLCKVLGKVHQFEDQEAFEKALRSVSDIADKVITDEWTIFINWEDILDLIVPKTLYKRRKIVNLLLIINLTKVPFFKVVSDVGFEQFNEDHTCPICFEEITRRSWVRQLPCKHIFHDECILNWILRDQEEIEDVSDWLNMTLSTCINYYTCPCCQTNIFDWFFFEYYKPSFLRYCEEHISPQDRLMIEREWREIE